MQNFATLLVTNTKKFQGSKLKKSSGRLLAINWRNVVTKCKLLVASLDNVNATTHSMVRSIRFDCLKIIMDKSRYKYGGKLALFTRFGTFFLTKAKQDKMKCLF